MLSKISFLIFCCITLISCNSQQKNTTDLSLKEEQLFKDIYEIGRLVADKPIWKGYQYHNTKQYLIHTTEGTPDRAFLINPDTIPKGAIVIPIKKTGGLKVYQYNTIMDSVFNHINNGNGSFDFFYKINQEDYFIMPFNDNDLSPNNELLEISLHENFHIYQITQWTRNDKLNQNFKDFPITKELLELQILVTEVLKNLPKKLSKEESLDLLKQYVAIRTKEIEIDTTSVIEQHEFWQERIEGTAHYVEKMSFMNYFNLKDSKFQLDTRPPFIDIELYTREDVKRAVSQRYLYDVGASIIWLLNELGVEIEKMEEGLSPYHLAFSYLNLSKEDMYFYFHKAKSTNNWGKVKEQAEKLNNITE